MLLVLAVLMKYRFQNLLQYMVYQSASGCMSEPVYSDLWPELVLFQFDTVLAAVVYRAVQELDIEQILLLFTNIKLLFLSLLHVTSFIS